MTAPNARAEMLAGLPLTHRRLGIGGIATDVFEGGHGPLLILLHGAIECGGAMWAPVVKELAQRYHLLVPDLPGLGGSAPAPGLDTETFTRWFNGLLDQTAFDGSAVVAHSMGGSLAARYAVDHGRRLSQLVVCAGPAVGPYRMPKRLRYVAIRFAIRPTRRNFDRFKRFALFDVDATRELNPAWFEAWDTYTRGQARKAATKRTMRRLVAGQRRPIRDADLDRISIPVSLVWGREDRMVPLDIARHAASRHGWPLRIIDRAAHAPHIEQPGRFVEALNDVLAGHVPSHG